MTAQAIENKPARKASSGFVRPEKIDDLNREELLWLVKNRLSYGLTVRDLLRARWEAMLAKAFAADKETQRLSDAWRALKAAPLPGTSTLPESHRKAVRYGQRERAWEAYEAQSRKAAHLHAAADEAYRALDATA